MDFHVNPITNSRTIPEPNEQNISSAPMRPASFLIREGAAAEKEKGMFSGSLLIHRGFSGSQAAFGRTDRLIFSSKRLSVMQLAALSSHLTLAEGSRRYSGKPT
ncbi:hypothetical protein S1OALGB6SA_1352 [Olavius algarvensis spirochete endosymbiont]|nr:hypothetical protein S1OALGB6SA_1352 [Olavius algarvensis spirochete endosymbiont]